MNTARPPGKKVKAVVHLSAVLRRWGPGEAYKAVDENSPCQPLTFYGKSKLAGEGGRNEILLLFASGYHSSPGGLRSQGNKLFYLSEGHP